MFAVLKTFQVACWQIVCDLHESNIKTFDRISIYFNASWKHD